MRATRNPQERIVPDETEPGIVALHLKRYEFARPLCERRDVLDAGCGVGYGSAFLAETARSVLGVDSSEEAIAYARQRYARPNVDFEIADALALDRPDRSFDVACAFELIEHLADQEGLVRELRRLLRPGGALVLSTPRVEETVDRPANPHHRRELAGSELEQLLRRHFDEVSLFGQRRLQTARHRAMQRLDLLGLRRRLGVLRPASRLLGTPATADLTSADIEIVPGAPSGATELLAVCR